MTADCDIEPGLYRARLREIGHTPEYVVEVRHVGEKRVFCGDMSGPDGDALSRWTILEGPMIGSSNRGIQSFSRIGLQASPTLFFRFTEHGGPTDDPLFADWSTKPTDLDRFMEAANRERPGLVWSPTRLLLSTAKLSPQAVATMRSEGREASRRSALAKLTIDEIAALGLKP